MGKLLQNKKAIVLFMAPAVLFFAAIVIAPVFLSGYYSLLDWDGMGEKVFIGFDNYVRLFTDTGDRFLLALNNSLLIAVFSLLIQLPMGMLFAILLSNGVRGERFFITVFFIPVIISTVAIGQLWGKIYNPDYGLLNTILRGAGLEHLARAWLGDKDTVLAAVITPIILQYRLLYAAFLFIDQVCISRSVRRGQD